MKNCGMKYQTMAAARMMMVSASSAAATSFLFKGPLLKPQTRTLRFNNNNRKRLFSCRALYKPGVLTTDEGQPETLDYRVFFHDNSGKISHAVIELLPFFFQ